MSGQSNDGGNRTENTEHSKAIFWYSTMWKINKSKNVRAYFQV